MAGEPAVRVTDNLQRRRYEAWVDDRLAAYASYERTPGAIAFLHTETEPGYEGHGVAGRLAQAALDDSRARGLRVMPRCPFFASYIDRHPVYADLVDPAA